MLDKRIIRHDIKAELLRLSKGEMEQNSASIIKQLEDLPAFADSRHILAYWPIQQEVDLRGLIIKWSGMGKQFYLPIVAGADLRIGRFEGEGSLSVSGSFGIEEPIEVEHTPALDLIVVPGLAFDLAGHRLGRGKGYYDRFLSTQASAYRVGVCHPVQLVPHVPTSGHDISVDRVLCGKV